MKPDNIDPETGEVLPNDADTEQPDQEQEADDESEPTDDEAEIDHSAAAVPSYDITPETMAGDIRDAMLSRFRQARKPWEQMVEQERRELVEGFGLAARNLVRDAVRLATGFEYPRVVVTLGEVKIKGEKGIEAKIGCPNISINREVLGDYVGDTVLMLMVDSERFMAERKAVDIPPDQTELPLEAETPGEPDGQEADTPEPAEAA